MSRIFLFLLSLFFSITLEANESVSIQLKWKHGFQFAGYYAALEKGYYRDEGLDVTLKEIDFNRNFIRDVVNGESEYGVSDSSLVVYRSQNTPVVLISQIFQHSPLVFISHRDSKITTPYEIVGKKVAFSIKGTGGAPFNALIVKTIGSFNDINISDFTSYQDFINKKFDVTSAYSTSQPYWLKKQGIDINIIDPKSYGIDFYGDNFFTSEKELKKYPKRVAKMKRATLKGWEYALNHQDEIIDVILKKYAPKKDKKALKFEARGTYQMIMPDLEELGSCRQEKYRQVIKTYHQLGIVKNIEIDNEFFYKDSENSLSKKEQNWIEENPMIKIAIMSYWESDNHGNNIHIDLIKLLNKYSDLNIVPVKFDAWMDGFKAASSGEHIHAIANISRSLEREKKFLFTKAYDFTPNYLIVRNDNSEIKSLEDLKNTTIYLKEKLISHSLIKDISQSIKVIDVRTDEEIYKKLSKKSDVVATVSYSIDREKLKKYNLKIAKTSYDKYGKIHIGISHKHPELQTIINKIYKIIPTEELTTLQNRVYVKNKNKTVNLTEKEKQWIKKHPSVSVGGELNWAPFSFKNTEDNYAGVSHDYLNLISKKTGLKFDVIVDKWSNTLQKMKENKIDLLSSIYYTDTRTAYMNYTKPYFGIIDYFFIRDDLEVKTIKDLDGKRVAISKDFALIDVLKKEFPRIKIVIVDTFLDSIDAVLENRADILFDTYTVLSYTLKKEGITTIIPFKSYRGEQPSKLHFASHKSNPILKEIINKALDSITQKEKNDIYERWLFSHAKPSNNFIKLTQKEKRWLDENPTITFAGDPNWLPFEAFDKSGKYIGIVADYLQSIEELISLKFNPIQTKNWSETTTLMLKGDIDVVSEDITSQFPIEHYNPIPTYIKSPMVIVMRGDHDFVDDIEYISDKKIALIADYGFNNSIKKSYPNQEFVYEQNADIGLESLSSGKIDALILSMPKAQYLISLQGFKSVKIAGKTRVNLNLTLFVHKSKPELHSIIQKSMRKLSNTKHLEILSRWQKIEFAEKVDYMLLYQIAGLLGFFLLGTIYWNRKLSREVIKRKELEAQIQTLIDNIPLQILVTSYDGKLLMVNPQALKDHGQTKEDMQKHNMSEFYADPKGYEEVINELQIRGRVDQKIIKFRHLDESVYSMMVSILPITYEKQNALLSIAVDLSERLEMEKELSFAKEEAENANLAKSEFLANMSHEIRTPMNSVMGFSQLLAKQINDPTQKDYLDSILRGGQALLRIINDILDLSKIEAGKLDIVLESVNMKQLSQEMEAMFQVKMIQKNLHFSLNIDPLLPKYLLLDSTRIRQILFNLLGNAIKFTSSGNIKLSVIKINEDIEKSKIDLLICVEDSGIGIKKEHLENIFNTFEQQNGQDAGKYGGTGLGLAICKKLVNIMNGSISVESELGKGSKFNVILKDVAISSIESETKELKKAYENIKFEKATVMVVDDIKDNRKLVTSILKEHNLDIIEAVDGKDAIVKLYNLKVNLIFMDMKMPVMDGYEATQIIKNDNLLKDIPIVALTASVIGRDMKKIKEYKFDGYLRKPVTYDKLLSEMGRFLKHKTLDIEVDTSPSSNNFDNIPKVTKILENEFTNTWKEIKDMGDFSLIEDFSISLEGLADDNGINLLKKYAKELKLSCESFDIENVDFMLNSYISLIQKLKELKN